MPTSRQKILLHLTKTRSASAREIARALKLSAPNVRHHLSVLCSDGRVEMAAVRDSEGRGRPEKMYSLAQSTQGDNLPLLLDALLVDDLDAKKIGERIAHVLAPQRSGEGMVMSKQLALLVETLNGMNYQAHWEAGAAGPRVILGRCPYSRVIANHPELCKVDLALINTLLGRSVTQTGKSKPAGQGLCPFVFIVE